VNASSFADCPSPKLKKGKYGFNGLALCGEVNSYHDMIAQTIARILNPSPKRGTTKVTDYLIVRIASLAAMLIIAPALAEGQATIDARTASKMIDGCVAHSTEKKQSHAIAIYDAGGQPVALLRMDGKSPGVTDFAMQKAAAVAHWRFSTAQMEASARATPGFGNAPRVVTVAGGVAVYSADGATFLGAVGVSGEAPQDDVACAEAAVKAAGLLVSRKQQ
jgi:uncharacterized protein GlcG (DUF336 family)